MFKIQLYIFTQFRFYDVTQNGDVTRLSTTCHHGLSFGHHGLPFAHHNEQIYQHCACSVKKIMINDATGERKAADKKNKQTHEIK